MVFLWKAAQVEGGRDVKEEISTQVLPWRVREERIWRRRWSGIGTPGGIALSGSGVLIGSLLN